MMTPHSDCFVQYVQILVSAGRLDRIEFMLELCAAILVGDLEKVNAMHADSRARYRERFGREAPYLKEVRNDAS